MEHRSALVAALGGVVALIVVACGGGQATPTPQPTPTPAEKPPAPTATPSLGPTSPPTTAPRPSPTPSPALATTGPAPRYGGVLQVRFGVNPMIWDTYQACCGFTHYIFQNVLNHLLRYEKESLSRIEGDLATSWEVSADGKTYTFRLRRDVQWQDGKSFTSADVLFNFQRAGDPRYTFNKERVANIASMEAPEPLVFRTTLKKVSASYIPGIASAFFLIYPAHVPDPAAWQSAPVGTGAHRVSQSSKDVSIELARNLTYFRKDAAGRQLPYLDGIKYTVIQEPGLALAAFRSGRVDCGCAFDQDYMTDQEEQLRKEIPGVKLGRYLQFPRLLLFNLQRPPFDNLAFRQAVTIGLDMAQFGIVVYRDKSIFPAPPFLMPPEFGGRWGLPKEELVKVPGFNPDHAKDLAIARERFVQSGLDPRAVSISVLATPFTRPEAEALASLLTTELGLKARVEVFPTQQVLLRQQQGDFQLTVETRGATVDDPNEWFVGYLSSKGAFNWGKYFNARLDDVLTTQDSELDPARRRALLWEAQEIVLADYPIVPLPIQLGVHGTRPEVFGFRVGPVAVSNVRLDDVWLER